MRQFATSAHPGRASVLPPVLRHRGFRQFWAAELISRIGFWLQMVGQSWLVWHLSRSPLTVGLVAAIQVLPALVLAPVGGMLADRLPRRRLLLATQLGLSLTAFGLWRLVDVPHAGVVAVASAAAISGILSAIDTPTRMALIPNLVPRDLIGQAVAVDTAGSTFARVIGPALAAALLSAFGPAECFLGNALSYVAEIVVLTELRLERDDRSHARLTASGFAAVREGFEFAARTVPVRSALLVLTVYIVLTMNGPTLLPPIADGLLRSGSRGLGLLIAAQGVGAFASTIATGWLDRHGIGQGSFLGPALFGAGCLVGFAITHTFMLALLFMVGAGLAQSRIVICVQRLLQAQAPEHLRGRVMAVFSQVMLGGVPLAALVAGALATATSAPAAMAGEAVAAVLLVAAMSGGQSLQLVRRALGSDVSVGG